MSCIHSLGGGRDNGGQKKGTGSLQEHEGEGNGHNHFVPVVRFPNPITTGDRPVAEVRPTPHGHTRVRPLSSSPRLESGPPDLSLATLESDILPMAIPAHRPHINPEGRLPPLGHAGARPPPHVHSEVSRPPLGHAGARPPPHVHSEVSRPSLGHAGARLPPHVHSEVSRPSLGHAGARPPPHVHSGIGHHSLGHAGARLPHPGIRRLPHGYTGARPPPDVHSRIRRPPLGHVVARPPIDVHSGIRRPPHGYTGVRLLPTGVRPDHNAYVYGIRPGTLAFWGPAPLSSIEDRNDPLVPVWVRSSALIPRQEGVE